MARVAAANRPEPAVHHEPELCPSRLSVDVEREDARVSLALRGELVLETAPQCREHLDDVEEDAMTPGLPDRWIEAKPE